MYSVFTLICAKEFTPKKRVIKVNISFTVMKIKVLQRQKYREKEL
jgi:hypothetical protein